MNLVSKLIKNDGKFELDDFYKHMFLYEKTFKSLLKSNRELAYKSLKHYYDEFKEIEREPFQSYRPGMDYVVSFYSIYQYALLEKNKGDKDYAYLLLLKRFFCLSPSMKKNVIDKKHILLKCAYPDLNDLYSRALYAVGNYLYKRKRYNEAFRFFKKGADFTDNGRQISFPFYLMARNQDKVGDMYRYGLGVKKNISLMKKYYSLAAENCGVEYHPKLGDFEYTKKQYTKAFFYYTSTYGVYTRYDISFLEAKNLDTKYKKIFEVLSNIPIETRHPFANVALSIMYYYGLGSDVDEEKSQALMPEDKKVWASRKYSMAF